MKRPLFVGIVLLYLLICSGLAGASSAESAVITQWLLLGPADVNDFFPAENSNNQKLLAADYIPLQDLSPRAGDKVQWNSQRTLNWERAAEGLQLNPPPGTHIVYLATYLQSRRWLQTELVFPGNQIPVEVYLDGRRQKTKRGDMLTSKLELPRGKHLLLLKILLTEETTRPFTVRPSLMTADPFAKDRIYQSLVPNQAMTEREVLNTRQVTGLSLSPNGQSVAVFLSRVDARSGAARRWLEIVELNRGQTHFNSESLGPVSGFRWVSDGNSFSFSRIDGGKTSIYTYDLSNHKQEQLLSNVADFSSYWWSPDRTFLIYSTSQTVPEGEGYKYVAEIPRRSSTPLTRNAFFVYYPRGKVTRRLTGFAENFTSIQISPDSKKVLLARSLTDYENRPFEKNRLVLFDLATASRNNLLEDFWITQFVWSPDGKQLLILGGPSAFKGIGRNLEDGKIANDYDNQAYLFEIESRLVQSISLNFKPSIGSAFWSGADKNLYLTAADQAYVRLYRYSFRQKTFTQLKTRVDVLSQISYASNRQQAVYWGSSAATPYKLFKINLKNGSSSLLKDFNKEMFAEVRLGKVEDWNYKTGSGKTIVGRLYYPPGFSADKRYPCIVYFYGGTSPVTRDFAGRYPKNWYAAQGYIVFVLQPSGATGFGQAFSAEHVNDWGKITSAEIIEGVRRLIGANPAIDSKRIGAIGASYGGFLSQYLATQTDMFAAHISHAGISSLSSYWGVGDWGYSYSAVASADSYPWNRKDLYVGHSPLFMAERITSPLLLLHGDIDNNVPPGESYQMFAALKLLGKEVALVTYAGQQHWILTYEKRLHWMRTIIAWFDKHLKDQPQWWQALYPEEKEKK